jgi:hypothetical protein
MNSKNGYVATAMAFVASYVSRSTADFRDYVMTALLSKIFIAKRGKTLLATSLPHLAYL